MSAILLGNGAIGDAGALAISRLIEQNTTLETVYLGCNAISADGVKYLCESLEAAPGVRGLWLKRNPIGNDGVAILAAMLGRNTALDTLDIVNCGFDPAALAPLCRVLEAENRSLRRLYAGGNGLGAGEADSLARVLSANPVLEALLLNSNHVGDAGAESLAVGLSSNASLRELGLGSNGLSERGATALANAVANHGSLEVLDLGRATSQSALGSPPNALGEAGAIALAHALRSNCSLRRLNLAGAGVPRAGAEQVLATAAEHPTLCDLRLDVPLSPAARVNLRRNRERLGERPEPDAVAAIRSVYRTARGGAA